MQFELVKGGNSNPSETKCTVKMENTISNYDAFIAIGSKDDSGIPTELLMCADPLFIALSYTMVRQLFDDMIGQLNDEELTLLQQAVEDIEGAGCIFEEY